MGTQNSILIDTHFRLVDMGSVHGLLCRKFVLFAASVSTLFFSLFGFFNRTLFREKRFDSSRPRNLDRSDLRYCVEKEAEAKKPEFDVSLCKDTEEKEEEAPKFLFKFQFQTYRENEEADSVPSTSTNKYEFLSGKNFIHYMEEQEVVNLSVKELYVESNGNLVGNKEENFADGKPKDEEAEKLVTETAIEESISEEGQAFEVENNASSAQDAPRDDVQFLLEKGLIASDSDSDSNSIASTSEGFLSDEDFEEAFKDIDREGFDLGDVNMQNSKAGDFEEEESDIMEELQKLEESISGNANPEEQSSNISQTKYTENSDKSWDCEDSNGLETLWEHQDLIEQLKMELKKVKATGLPTILEEDEIMEDLKPWKIDEKFQHEDKMGELHKFYRSYGERMRKFDILNYQKKFAMSFLQAKDPLQSMSSFKANPSSLLSQKFLLCRRKKSGSDPMMSFIRELHSDLEMVYVGQMCLSWEILHWQYEKAVELWDSDPLLVRRYNEVAGEFQQFQVLMQRFIENEPFEDPRVQNYVKSRCVLRNLLQVPMIREDGVKDKKAKRRGKDDDAITSDMLIEILEESIRIFWRFVRADKDSQFVVQKGRKGTQIEPIDPSELELLTEVRASLQKKEKLLRDTLRGGNCILKMLKKHEEEASSDQVHLYFFSQVDMKLVSRVLNMSKITMEQLVWCHNKLSKINFVSRKIHVEPSFFLFPC